MQNAGFLMTRLKSIRTFGVFFFFFHFDFEDGTVVLTTPVHGHSLPVTFRSLYKVDTSIQYVHSDYFSQTRRVPI